MGLTVGAEDILSIDIKYRERDEITDGYAVVYLREHIPDVNAFHFSFSMSNTDFTKQLASLSAMSEKSGFELKMSRKNRFLLALEKMMVGALAGTEYQSQGCPACRMIDTFVSSGRYTIQ